ncbi:hypothetical protein Tco_0104978 [Tanacetum coccineum]
MMAYEALQKSIIRDESEKFDADKAEERTKKKSKQDSSKTPPGSLQRFDESFYEAWDRFNDLLRACPHHGFSELHQLDTFYNALNSNDQDSLNSATGGNFLDKMPREWLKIIESKSKVRNSRSKPVVAKVSTSTSTPVSLPIQGPIYQPQVNQPPTYQAPVYQAPAPQTQGVSKTDFDSYVKANDAVMRNVQNQVMNRDTEVTKNTMLPTNNGSTEDVQPPVIQVQSQNLTSKPDVDPDSAPMPNQRTSIHFLQEEC